MLITDRLSATWHLGLVRQLIMMLAVCPSFAELRITTPSFDEVQFGQPLAISWDGIDVDTSLIVSLLSDLDTETVDIDFNIDGNRTSPRQRELIWTPDEHDFGGEILDDPSFRFYIELIGVDGDGNPNEGVAYAESPDFTIHPRDAVLSAAPTSASPISSTVPTSITSSALPPSSTHREGPAPSPKEELSLPMKIGIGVGATMIILLVITLAGLWYRFFARKKDKGTASGTGTTYIVSTSQPLPAATITNAVPEIQTNPVSPDDYKDRRWRPYNVPANFGTPGTPYGPDDVASPPAYVPPPPPRVDTMPTIHTVAEVDARPMSAGSHRVSHADIPASLIPGGLPHRPASCPGGLPYPV